MRVAVIGVGPMAQGFCALATRSGAIIGGDMEVRMCSRKAMTEEFLEGLPQTPVVPLAEGLEWAEAVVLALPAGALPGLCAQHGPLLASKVVIDITNPSKADVAAITAAAAAVKTAAGRGSSAAAGKAAPPPLKARPSTDSGWGGNCSQDSPHASAGSGDGPGHRSGSSDVALVMAEPQEGAECAAIASPAPSARKRNFYMTACSSLNSSFPAAADVPPASGAAAVAALLSAHAAAGPVTAAAAAAAKSKGGDDAGSSKAQRQTSELPPPLRLAKALCNVSAYMLINGDPLVDTIRTVAASDCAETAKLISRLLGSMGVACRAVPSLGHAAALEGWHHRTFPEWLVPTAYMLAQTILLFVFSAVRYNHYDHYPWYQATMWVSNKAFGWSALWGLLACYLPGMVISYIQLVRRVPSFRLWGWVQSWMDARKQIGLLSLLLTLLHLACSTYLFMPGYYSKLWLPAPTTAIALGPAGKVTKFGIAAALPQTPFTVLADGAAAAAAGLTVPAAASGAGSLVVKVSDAITQASRLNWQGEASMFVGILAGTAMLLTGLTSAPSISHRLNWSEWVTAQSYVGWFSLAASTAHTLLLGVSWWSTAKTAWPEGIPTITLLSTAPCIILIVFKMLLALPPLSWALRKVRSGAWGRPSALCAIYVKRG
ncbi:hypothetical protein HYH03_003543 [Edaphochlamys debaryana]|uniref:Pyrroline-5-carboxylate reductase catalytic N-terminal domain-containing protein n=1 Tax=Edaphochlamys debaryana TaxID=47281 RepID=A0A836C406_9CHLO|nr:hypothetical protein HYH03_003543 [Edaphochlamys debaryana]|eukprot:KAG2498282.1 hypothetical protein HYH03_003543 [Edaphochlamys debaryana]